MIIAWSKNHNSHRYSVPVQKIERIDRNNLRDISNPIISTFIKLDSDGMVQTVKFKPNDNLYFRVFLFEFEILICSFSVIEVFYHVTKD